VTSTRATDEDAQFEAGLRPRTLDEYIGQDRVRENLHVSITAAGSAARRSTTSCCTARRAGQDDAGLRHRQRARVPVRTTSGRCSRRPAISRDAHQPQGARVLFIDEIHRMAATIEEILYPASRTTSSTS